MQPTSVRAAASVRAVAGVSRGELKCHDTFVCLRAAWRCRRPGHERATCKEYNETARLRVAVQTVHERATCNEC